MNDLKLVFLAGLLGSAHCLGMCGAFALAISASSAKASIILRQLTYLSGKAITYTIMGAGVGLLGSAFSSGFTGFQRVLSIGAGCLMIVIGLGVVGVFRRIESALGIGQSDRFRRWMGFFLKRRGLSGAIGLGLVNGLLPCGLVYGMLAKASSTGSAAGGALTMAVFGLATFPALFILGLTGHLMRPVWRRWADIAGGLVVIALGVMMILRGTGTPMMHGSHGTDQQVEQPAHIHGPDGRAIEDP